MKTSAHILQRDDAIQGLRPDIAGVQAACNRRISRPLDDGPPIRKERNLVRLAEKLKHKVVVSDTPEWFQAAADFGEIDRPLPLVDLDGVPSA